MKSSLFAAALFVLSAGCFNQELGDVKVTLEDKIDKENGADIKFAIFGTAEANGQTSMVIIASDQEDLCGEMGNNAAAFINDIQSGEEAGDFVLTNILVDGALGDGVRFDGDKQQDQIVDPQFLIGNGAKLQVGAVDQDAEARLFVDAFDGETFAGRIEANLNKDLTAGLFGNKDLNNPLTVEIFTSTQCAALSDFAQEQL